LRESQQNDTTKAVSTEYFFDFLLFTFQFGSNSFCFAALYFYYLSDNLIDDDIKL
jgi:hypothetical protein